MNLPIIISLLLAAIGFVIGYFVHEATGKVIMLLAFLTYLIYSIFDAINEYKKYEIGFERFSKILLNFGFVICGGAILFGQVIGPFSQFAFNFGILVFLIGIFGVPVISKFIDDRNTNK